MVGERVIRISDLFWYILSKWKLLILAVVIGALLCGGYRYFSAGQKSSSSDSKEPAKAVVSDGLNSYDHAAAQLMFRYLALAEKQLEYIRTAEFMQIDPYHADVSSASFCITCGKGEDTDAVLEAYSSVLEEMKSQYGELLTYSLEKGFSNYYSVDPGKQVAILDQNGTKNGLVQVKIYGVDEASCKDRIREITDRLMASSKEIREQVLDHALLQVGSYTTNVSSPELLLLQKNAADTMYQMTNYMNNIQKSFSADATDYVSDMTAKGKIPDIQELAENGTEKDTAAVQTTSTAKSAARSKKALIKGAVLGGAALLILAVILLCVYYILSGKLRFEDDINGLFGIPCLGIVADSARKQKTGIDRKIEEKRYRIRGLKKGSAEIAAAQLELAAQKAGSETLYVTGTQFSEKQRHLAEELKALLQGKGIELKVGEPLLADAASIEDMGRVGETVLIESAEETGRTDLAGKLAFCRESRIHTLGMILLA